MRRILLGFAVLLLAASGAGAQGSAATPASGTGAAGGLTSATPVSGAPQPTLPSVPPVQTIVPSATPAQDTAPTNTASQTCTPTMAMLNAIDCSIYPATQQAFCNENKPKLMDMAHCQSAEQYAQNAPPSGSRVDECKKLTFNKGTSSWSFVLACGGSSAQGAGGNGAAAMNGGSGASGANSGGATGSGVNPAGADPQCLQKLQASGAKFSSLGQRVVGSAAGQQCVVATDVKYSNRDVNYAGEMDCNLAALWENFGKKLKAMGVTNVGNFGTIGCRVMNNGHSASSNLSKHSYGYAADMDPWTIGGATVSGSRYFTDPVSAATLTSIVQAACDSFNLVLAFRYYQGKQGIHHIHAQFSQHGCDPPWSH